MEIRVLAILVCMAAWTALWFASEAKTRSAGLKAPHVTARAGASAASAGPGKTGEGPQSPERASFL